MARTRQRACGYHDSSIHFIDHALFQKLHSAYQPFLLAGLQPYTFFGTKLARPHSMNFISPEGPADFDVREGSRLT